MKYWQRSKRRRKHFQVLRMVCTCRRIYGDFESEGKGKNRPRPGVRLMTIHASKGLEFKQVFLIAANEGRIPYQKAKTDKEIEEERRLFYVAMTRAKDFLKICYVKIKNGKEVTPPVL